MIKTYTDAMATGYRVTAPDHPSKTLAGLCSRLGPEYHLAMIDGCNVIHRVIGDGWDMEIWHAGRGKYNITLWKGYGRQSVATEENVPDNGDAVKCMVEMMLHVYVPANIYPTKYPLGPRPSATTTPSATH